MSLNTTLTKYCQTKHKYKNIDLVNRLFTGKYIKVCLKELRSRRNYAFEVKLRGRRKLDFSILAVNSRPAGLTSAASVIKDSVNEEQRGVSQKHPWATASKDS